MGYQPPAVNFRKSILEIKQAYQEYIIQNKKKNKNFQPNIERIKLISLAEILIEYLAKLNEEKKISDDKLQSLFMPIYIFVWELISKEYKWISADFSEGYLWNSGSFLRKLFSVALNINKKNPISRMERFIFLEKFTNFILQTDQSLFPIELYDLKKILAEHNLNLEFYQKCALILLGKISNFVKSDINNFIQAIPTEEAIHKKMANLYDDYLKRKQRKGYSFFRRENLERKFLAQLGQAICNLQPIVPDHTLGQDDITRTQRIKLGLLTLILGEIDHEKKYMIPILHSPKNSDLYFICAETYYANQKDPIIALLAGDWLYTLKSYLNDNGTKAAIEHYGREHFAKENLLKSIDPKIEKISHKIHYAQINSSSNRLSELMAFIMAAPGYGLGYIIGGFIATQDSTVSTKENLGVKVSQATAYFGLSGRTMGFLAADFFIGSTLTRFFAQVLELLGIAVGCIAGYTIGLTFDLSYQGLKYLCHFFLHLHDHYKDKLIYIKNADVEFIKSTIRIINLLPEIDLLDEEKKMQLKKLAKENFAITEDELPKLTITEDESTHAEINQKPRLALI